MPNSETAPGPGDITPQKVTPAAVEDGASAGEEPPRPGPAGLVDESAVQVKSLLSV